MRVLPVVMLSAGIVLMYAAIKNRDPRDVIRQALGQKPTNAVLVNNTASSGTSPVATPITPFTVPPGTHVTSI